MIEPIRRPQELQPCLHRMAGARRVTGGKSSKPRQLRRLQELLACVADGDLAAARQLRARLAPAIAVMVRRALRFPADSSLLQDAVHAEVRRLGLTARDEFLAEDPQIVRLIAGRIWARVIEGLRFGSTRLPVRETVNDLDRFRN